MPLVNFADMRSTPRVKTHRRSTTRNAGPGRMAGAGRACAWQLLVGPAVAGRSGDLPDRPSPTVWGAMRVSHRAQGRLARGKGPNGPGVAPACHLPAMPATRGHQDHRLAEHRRRGVGCMVDQRHLSL